MQVLPRYQFREGEPCPHGSPDCLCDVDMSLLVNSPINRDVNHQFHRAALDELGDYTVNERNIYEFFQIVLGMDYMWRSEVCDDPAEMIVQPDQLRETRAGKPIGPEQWRRLPEHIVRNLRRHYKVGSPWSLAQREVEGLGYSIADMTVLGRYYETRRKNAIYKSRNRSTSVLSNCEMCGKQMANKGGQRLTCSQVCRNKKTKRTARARAAAAAAAAAPEQGVCDSEI